MHCLTCWSAQFETTNHNKYICSTCGFVFYFNASGAAVLLLKDDHDRYLRTIRGKEPYKGTLGVIGWFIDPWETAEDAACRECVEEIGIQIAPHSLSYVWSFAGSYVRSGLTRQIINIVFVTTITDDQIATITPTIEVPERERHTLETFPIDRLAPSLKNLPTLFQTHL